MGTYSKSTFGEISGKVGESVASNWRSLKVLRSVPKKSSKPPSEKRLAVYARFTLAAARLSPIKSVLNIGFSDKTLNKITGYNAAVKTFLTESILGDYPNYQVDYANIKMSKGSLDQPDVSIEVVNDIVLTWPADVDELRSNLDDRMYFIIYNEMKDSYKLNIASTRNDAAIALPFPGKAGDVLHVWSFCVSRDGKLVSRSQYVGSVTVPV
jgi:hypothetical protein